MKCQVYDGPIRNNVFNQKKKSTNSIHYFLLKKSTSSIFLAYEYII